jgi:predicted Zn-dependent protease
LPQLQGAHNKNPTDADTAARLAEQLLLRRRDDEAQKLADDVLNRHPAHPLASYVKAQMLLNAGNNDQARAVLEAGLTQGTGEPKVVGTLGKLYSQSKDFGKAAEMFELARKVEPLEPRWLSELAEIYRQAGDRDRQLAALRDLAQADSDDIDTRKRAARLLLEMGDSPGAQKFALQALEIDPADALAEELFGDTLLGQRKWAEAVDVYEIVLELDSRRDAARIHMAQALLESGKKTRAAGEIDRVLARDPENAEAQRLRTRLDR